MSIVFWTPEADRRALDLWDRGHTADEVAAMIGASSRGAVLGRLWRLGQSQERRITGRRTAQGSRGRPGRRWGPPTLAGGPLPPQTEVACSPRPWLTRDDHECAYPVVGESEAVLSCCNPCGRRTYCPEHHLAVHEPPAVASDEPAGGVAEDIELKMSIAGRRHASAQEGGLHADAAEFRT